jgi:hypothetical protein
MEGEWHAVCYSSSQVICRKHLMASLMAALGDTATVNVGSLSVQKAGPHADI